ANAHVALVWKVGGTGSWEVGADVAVTGGQFSMNLAAPPASYFLTEVDFDPVLGEDAGVSWWGAAADAGAPDLAFDASAPDAWSAGDAGAPEWSSSSGGNGMFDFGRGITPQDTISGSITKPLRVALAGFVVYVDKNGNGKLDLE